jgi:hypothetical protein
MIFIPILQVKCVDNVDVVIKEPVQIFFKKGAQRLIVVFKRGLYSPNTSLCLIKENFFDEKGVPIA